MNRRENENEMDYARSRVRLEEKSVKGQGLLLGKIVGSEVQHPWFALFVSWKDGDVKTKGHQLTSEHPRDNLQSTIAVMDYPH